jgi:hypothetical protein
MRVLVADGLRLDPLVAADAERCSRCSRTRRSIAASTSAAADVASLRARYARLESRASADGRSAG